MVNSVAIIVPCFNEERRFPIDYWSEILATENQIKWLFVNDGSSDDTHSILKELCSGKSAQVLNLPKNIGKGNAIRHGFLEITHNEPEIRVLGYLDSDGAFGKDDVFRLAELIIRKLDDSADSKLDAVISSRVSLSGRTISRKVSRHYIGRIIATLLTNKWKGAPYDTQSGYKLFSNSNAFRSSISDEFTTRWFVDIEILTRIGIYNKGRLSIWEEPLYFWRDIGGSKLNFKNYISVLLELFVARQKVLKFLKERSSQSGSN